MKRPHHRVRTVLAGLALTVLMFVMLDQAVGNWQERELARRVALKARLDKLSFDGLRTGIDDITFADGRYQIQLRVQNAAREPFYILVPILEGFVQVGPTWEPFRIVAADGHLREGTVLRLVGEQSILKEATIEGFGYAEPIAGYRHVKITLEAFVSPEEDPQEEIGERREEFFLFLRDVTRDAEFTGSTRRPSFIPLRAWTLLPKDAL